MKRIACFLFFMFISCVILAQDRREVVILDFVSHDRDASTSEACTVIFRSNLASNMQWALVDAFRVSNEMKRMNYAMTNVTDVQLTDICEGQGIDDIVIGNLRSEGEMYVLNVRVIDVASRKVKGVKSTKWKAGTPFRDPVMVLANDIKPFITMSASDDMMPVADPVSDGTSREIVSAEGGVSVPVSANDANHSIQETELPASEMNRTPRKTPPSGLLINGYDSCSKVDLDPAGGEWVVKVTLENGIISEDCVISPPTSWYKAELSASGDLKLVYTSNQGEIRRGKIIVSAGEESVDFTFIQPSLPNHIEENVWMSKLSRLLGSPSATYTNGAYRGGLVDFPIPDTRNGIGLYRWSDDTIYLGMWSQNKKNGRGIHSTPKGLVFAQLPGCRIMVSDFLNDVPRGKMRCYDRHGRLLYDGSVFDWSPESVYPAKDMNSAYRFDFIEYDDGSCYIGEVSNGRKNGYGLFIDSSGQPWVGTWNDDNKVEGSFF